MEQPTINHGVAILSRYQQKPTVVCGNGRSGTSGLMAALIGGGLPCIESTASVTHEHYETVHAWKSPEDGPSGLSSLRKQVALNYSPIYFTKVPGAEWHAHRNKKAAVWDGNYLGITRDITAAALREWSVDPKKRDILHFYEVVQRRQEAAVADLLSLSRDWGVAIVSYEKLLSSPEMVLEKVAGWIDKDINIDAAMSMIVPNNNAYLNRQREYQVTSG